MVGDNGYGESGLVDWGVIFKKSTVSDHQLQCNCWIDFYHFDMLASEPKKFRLLIKENLLIKSEQPQ